MKHVGLLLGMVVIALIACGFVYVEENVWLYNSIIPPPDVPLEQWLDNFRLLAINISVIGALLLAVIWYVTGQWLVRIDDWRSSGKRIVWLWLFALAVVLAIICMLLTPQAQAGAWAAYLFYVVNSVLCFYFACALFSPSSFKYTPLGATFLRRW